MIGYLEEHEYYLEQLVRNKELIDNDKLDNIREDMDNFLIHPGTQLLREELKAEYQHMLEDIVQELEEQKIEQHKLDIEKDALGLGTQTTDSLLPEPVRQKTRKELREERLKMEKQVEEKEEHKEEIEEEDNGKFGFFQCQISLFYR